MTSEWTKPGDEPPPDPEWGWVADVYREVPTARPESVGRALGMAEAEAALRGRRRSRGTLWWALGIAAVVALVVLGRGFIISEPARVADVDRRPTPTSRDSLAGSNPQTDSLGAPAVAQRPESLGTRVLTARPLPRMESRGDTTNVRPAPLVIAEDRASPSGDPVGIPGLKPADLERLRARLGDSGVRKLAVLVQRAKGDSLPTAPLLDRAMAGLVHAASPATILAVVERREVSLRQARAALGDDANPSELTAGADALEAGAIASQLVEVRRLFPRGRATAGLVALAGLVTDGVPAPAATAALARGVRIGASDAALLALRRGVADDVARGVPPLTALHSRVERLGDVAPAPRSPSVDPVFPPSPDVGPRVHED